MEEGLTGGEEGGGGGDMPQSGWLVGWLGGWMGAVCSLGGAGLEK